MAARAQGIGAGLLAFAAAVLTAGALTGGLGAADWPTAAVVAAGLVLLALAGAAGGALGARIGGSRAAAAGPPLGIVLLALGLEALDLTSVAAAIVVAGAAYAGAAISGTGRPPAPAPERQRRGPRPP
jgi:hypothetical protein